MPAYELVNEFVSRFVAEVLSGLSCFQRGLISESTKGFVCSFVPCIKKSLCSLTLVHVCDAKSHVCTILSQFGGTKPEEPFEGQTRRSARSAASGWLDKLPENQT